MRSVNISSLILKSSRPAVALILCCMLPATTQAGSKQDLRTSISRICNAHKAIVGVSAIHLERNDTFTFNDAEHYPMQSVYKLPLALAVLQEVDKKRRRLDERITISKSDLPEDTWSPLQKKMPEGGEVSIADLLYYSVSYSDNNACDILFNLMKGPEKVNKYVHSLGVKDIRIVSVESEMRKNSLLQYANWARPSAISGLLKGLYEGRYLSDSSNKFLLHLLTETFNSPARIRGMLPADIKVAHKTGTSTRDQHYVYACNDAGIIYLPGGGHVVLSILVMNSHEQFDVTEEILAEIGKEIFDHYNGRSSLFLAKKVYESGRLSLPYRMLAPPDNDRKKSYPLLIYLHGSGARGTDNQRHVKNLHPSFTDSANRWQHPAWMLFPQCPDSDYWVVFPGFPNSLSTPDKPTQASAALIALVREMIHTRNVDANRIYLCGYSMGGEGTLDLLAHEPELFACGLAIASVADTSKAGRLKDIPVWLFHGSEDKVNPPQYAKMEVEAIQAKGGKARLNMIPSAGHDCRQEAFGNPEVWEWMFRQKKK